MLTHYLCGLPAILLLLTEILFSSCRWKTHKWRRCQLVPWSVQQDVPGAQEGCGPGRQARGGRMHTRVDVLHTSSSFYLVSPPPLPCCIWLWYQVWYTEQSRYEQLYPNLQNTKKQKLSFSNFVLWNEHITVEFFPR